MVDTLRLNLIDCEIKKSCPLTVQPGLVDYSTGKTFNESDLFIDNTGRIVTGSKAYLNHDKFNLTIQPTVETTLNDFNQSKLKVKRFKRIQETIQPDLYDWNCEDEVKGIFIQTSLPRLLSETNLKTLSYDEQKKALKILEGELRTYGIRTNIFNANLSRVDTFTNLKTDFPFYSYSNLFSLMDFSRMKSVGYGNESFLWKNGNNELAVYDKMKEILDKNPKSKLKEKNIMRIENRLLKKRSISPFIYSTELKTVNDLFNNYDELKYFHSLKIGEKLFKYNETEINGLIKNNYFEKLKTSKKIFGKKWFYGYCFNYGAFDLAKNVNEDFINDMINYLDEGTDLKKRVKKSRVLRQLQYSKILFGLDGKLNKINYKSTIEMYDELKTKFYKEVA